VNLGRRISKIWDQVLTKISISMLRCARPLLRSLPRGSGKLYRLLGGRRTTNLWRSYGCPVVRGVEHGYLMELDLADTFERETYWSGRFYEWELEVVIERFVGRNDTFIDVGANIGMITLTAGAKVGPQGVVLAFEPNPEARARLRKHLKMNCISNVRIFDKALSNQRTTLRLNLPTDRTGTGTLRKIAGAKKSIEIEVAMLDDFVGFINPIGRIFLKTDTEGYDFNVLKGARKLLSRPNVLVFAEMNEIWLSELGQTPEQMVGYMNEMGFQAYLPRVERKLLRRELKLEPLHLPGPHYWYNALFIKDLELK
jgi:FkbM family methyltransferase